MVGFGGVGVGLGWPLLDQISCIGLHRAGLGWGWGRLVGLDRIGLAHRAVHRVRWDGIGLGGVGSD